MAGKNKGGREVRKPKQAKTVKPADALNPVTKMTSPKKPK
jgi:hypothetical protein